MPGTPSSIIAGNTPYPKLKVNMPVADPGICMPSIGKKQDVKDDREVIQEEKVLEVCIALSALPADALILQEMSQRISAFTATELKAATLVQLGRSDVRLAVAPHLTLYQCSLPIRHVSKACMELDWCVLLCFCAWCFLCVLYVPMP